MQRKEFSIILKLAKRNFKKCNNKKIEKCRKHTSHETYHSQKLCEKNRQEEKWEGK